MKGEEVGGEDKKVGPQELVVYTLAPRAAEVHSIEHLIGYFHLVLTILLS